MDPAAPRLGFPALGRFLARMLRAAAAFLERPPLTENASDRLAATMELLRRRYPDAPEHWLRFVAERHPAPDIKVPATRPPSSANAAQPSAVAPRFSSVTARAAASIPPVVRASPAPASNGRLPATARSRGSVPATQEAPRVARMPVPRPLFRSAHPSRPTIVAQVPPVPPGRPPSELSLSGRNSTATRVIRWAPETPRARDRPALRTVEAPSLSVIARNRFAQTVPPAEIRREPARALANDSGLSPAMTPASRQVEVAGPRSMASAARSDATLQFMPADNSRLARGARFTAGEPPWPELPDNAAPENTHAKAPAFDSPRTTEETHPWNGLPF